MLRSDAWYVPYGMALALFIAALLATGTPVAGATVRVSDGCIHDLSATCGVPNVAPARRELFPPERVGNGADASGPLILKLHDGVAWRKAGPAFALVRLFTGLSGNADARLWLVDAGRGGELHLFCLRFQRQTWTAGHLGDLPMGLPLAAMIATHSGALALNAP